MTHQAPPRLVAIQLPLPLDVCIDEQSLQHADLHAIMSAVLDEVLTVLVAREGWVKVYIRDGRLEGIQHLSTKVLRGT